MLHLFSKLPEAGSKSVGLMRDILVLERYRLARFHKSNKNNKGNGDVSVGKMFKSKCTSRSLAWGGEQSLFEVCVGLC